MRAIITAFRGNDGGALLKRVLGETLLARAVRTAREIHTIKVVYALTDCSEYGAHLRALNALDCGPLDRFASEPVVCLDAHYPLISKETIEKAGEVANILLCPVQSICPVADHPALAFETIELLHTAAGINAPEHSVKVPFSSSSSNDTIYWVNVQAFKAGNILAGGWTEFTVPTWQQTFARTPQPPQAQAGAFVQEIMINVIAEARGGEAVITAFWNQPPGADEFHVNLYRTSCALSGWAKQYTIPGFMHADPISGCLVNPTTGVKLINRQALPPLRELTFALIAGTAKDAADILTGRPPRALRGVCLTEKESFCVRNEIDILRLRQILAPTSIPEGVPTAANSESRIQ